MKILTDNAGGGGTSVEDGPGQDPHVCAQAQGRDLIYKMTALQKNSEAVDHQL
jgi:hypothetical protein